MLDVLKSLAFLLILILFSPLVTRAQSYKQSVGLSSQVNVFDEVFDPMFNQSISYSRTTSIAEFIAKLNHTYRFEQNGVQFELDAYPKFGNGRYAYVSYAYSNSVLFTDHRFGGELYSPVGERFEASLGLRYLHFKSGDVTTMYTGSISYYYRSFLFSFRPFIIPNDDGVGTAVGLSMRYYLNDADFIIVRAGAGQVADRGLTQLSTGVIGTNLIQLESQSVGASIQKKIGKQFSLTGGLGISRDELLFRPDSFVINFSFDMGIKYAFN